MLLLGYKLFEAWIVGSPKDVESIPLVAKLPSNDGPIIELLASELKI